MNLVPEQELIELGKPVFMKWLQSQEKHFFGMGAFSADQKHSFCNRFSLNTTEVRIGKRN